MRRFKSGSRSHSHHDIPSKELVFSLGLSSHGVSTPWISVFNGASTQMSPEPWADRCLRSYSAPSHLGHHVHRFYATECAPSCLRSRTPWDWRAVGWWGAPSASRSSHPPIAPHRRRNAQWPSLAGVAVCRIRPLPSAAVVIATYRLRSLPLWPHLSARNFPSAVSWNG